MFDAWYDVRCQSCHLTWQLKNDHQFAEQQQQLIEEANAQQKLHDEIDAIMLTTETAPNLNITKRIEVVTAECAFGMNIFKDLFAGVRDIVGGRSKAVQKTMRDSRRTALYELKKEAHEVGANAVVGVDLDYVELSAGGSMVLLVASGTAVIIELTQRLRGETQ
jgi:uncharacterized protein YbjQ (UPF0145 family)